MEKDKNDGKDTEINNKEASKKKSNGRRKIPIEAITDQTKKHVTFSKRRVGLFKKASELCALCGVEIAVLTFSARGKLFCFGHPNPDAVIHRYLKYETHCSDPADEIEDFSGNKFNLMVKEHNRRYEGIKRKIDEEKRLSQFLNRKKFARNDEKDGKSAQKMMEIGGFWWDEAPVDEMGSDELEQFMNCLVELRNNVANRVHQLTGATLPFLSSQMDNVDVGQINTNHDNGNNLGYIPQGYNFVGDLTCSGSAQTSNSQVAMLGAKSNMKALEDNNIDVSQSFDFGMMNEIRAMNGLRLEDSKDFTHFPNLSQGTNFVNVAVMNHQVTVKEDHGTTSSNSDVPCQVFKYGAGHF